MADHLWPGPCCANCGKPRAANEVGEPCDGRIEGDKVYAPKCGSGIVDMGTNRYSGDELPWVHDDVIQWRHLGPDRGDGLVWSPGAVVRLLEPGRVMVREPSGAHQNVDTRAIRRADHLCKHCFVVPGANHEKWCKTQPQPVRRKTEVEELRDMLNAWREWSKTITMASVGDDAGQRAAISTKVTERDKAAKDHSATIAKLCDERAQLIKDAIEADNRETEARSSRDAVWKELMAIKQATMLDPPDGDYAKLTPDHVRQHVQDMGDACDKARGALQAWRNWSDEVAPPWGRPDDRSDDGQRKHLGECLQSYRKWAGESLPALLEYLDSMHVKSGVVWLDRVKLLGAAYDKVDEERVKLRDRVTTLELELSNAWEHLDHRVDGQPFWSDREANGGGERMELCTAIAEVLAHYRSHLAAVTRERNEAREIAKVAEREAIQLRDKLSAVGDHTNGERIHKLISFLDDHHFPQPDNGGTWFERTLLAFRVYTDAVGLSMIPTPKQLAAYIVDGGRQMAELAARAETESEKHKLEMQERTAERDGWERKTREAIVRLGTLETEVVPLRRTRDAYNELAKMIGSKSTEPNAVYEVMRQKLEQLGHLQIEDGSVRADLSRRLDSMAEKLHAHSRELGEANNVLDKANINRTTREIGGGDRYLDTAERVRLLVDAYEHRTAECKEMAEEMAREVDPVDVAERATHIEPEDEPDDEDGIPPPMQHHMPEEPDEVDVYEHVIDRAAVRLLQHLGIEIDE